MSLSNRAVTHLRELIGSGRLAPEQTPGDNALEFDADDTAERYTLHEIIGQGGMGTVYRAHDVMLGRDVAFKVLDARRTLTDNAGERLRREAGILAQLEHPGIVPVYDTGVLNDGRTFYVMRLVRGERLDEHIAKGVSRGDVLRLMLRLCETVAFANALGVVHRDLKPGNIMIGPFGETLVLDWGVAKVLSGDVHESDALPAHLLASEEHTKTADGVIVGTPGYMSPEQQAGRSATVTQTADVFALGVILREMLLETNETRNSGSHPRALNAIVNRATAVEPDARYDSAAALANDVRRWLDGQSVSAYREGTHERVMRLYRQNQPAVLLVLTYLVVRTIILLWRQI